MRATGERRGGPPKGQKSKALVPGGGRTTKSLARVYQDEGLPELRDLTPGEERIVKESGAAEHVANIRRDRVVARSSGSGNKRGAKARGA